MPTVPARNNCIVRYACFPNISFSRDRNRNNRRPSSGDESCFTSRQSWQLRPTPQRPATHASANKTSRRGRLEPFVGSLKGARRALVATCQTGEAQARSSIQSEGSRLRDAGWLSACALGACARCVAKHLICAMQCVSRAQAACVAGCGDVLVTTGNTGLGVHPSPDQPASSKSSHPSRLDQVLVSRVYGRSRSRGCHQTIRERD